VYHHPQEDLVFAKLRTRDPVAAAKVGDLAPEHHKGAERLRRVAHAIENVLADGEVRRRRRNAQKRFELRGKDICEFGPTPQWRCRWNGDAYNSFAD
jgi:hypothetical protein